MGAGRRVQGESTAHADPVFGPWARRLEARCLLAGGLAPAAPGDLARLAFAAGELPPAVLDELRAAARSLRAAPTPGGLACVEIDVAHLHELAESLPELGPLRAAATNARRAPAPPRVVGIVNVTPDSFSDGGRFLAPERAIEHGRALAEAGADVLDVGGESTRPGAEDVPAAEELERVLPVVEALASERVPVSIDTRKAAVAAAALEAGATVVNDVSAGTYDERMLPLVAERGCCYVCMHMLGTPRDMQADPRYEDPVREIIRYLRERVAACLKAGMELRRIVVDPGIGFGKRQADNVALIRATGELRSLGLPVLLGPSRKSFLSAISGAPWSAEKTGETASACAAGVLFGAELLRVHDVATLAPAIRVAHALAVPTTLPTA